MNRQYPLREPAVAFTRRFMDVMVEAASKPRADRRTILEQKRARPFGKFYWVHEEPLDHKIVGPRREQRRHIYTTYYDFGNVYDRKGKR